MPPTLPRSMRRLLGGCLALSLGTAGLVAQTPPGKADARPNVILLMTDDQGYGDFGSTGNSILETPALDQLAADGVQMERFYVHPVCSPTRAALMTGRYPQRTRVTDTYIGRSMMEPDEVTIAEHLSRKGYRTGVFGKWHLGDCYPMRPQDQGFDTTLVHGGGGLAQPVDPPENRRRYTDPILFANGKPVATQGYCTDVFFDAAIRFIDTSLEKDQPFFAYIATNAPHTPLHDVPEKLYRKYLAKDLDAMLLDPPPTEDAPQKARQQWQRRRDILARVYAMIENIDTNIGRLRQHLRERDIERDTLILFLSDNGPQQRRYVGPMRGVKENVVEGGIRTPFFACWPRKLPAGHIARGLGAHIDVLPTILAATGTPLENPSSVDGVNLWPRLTGTGAPKPRQIIIQGHRGDRPHPEHHFAVIEDRYKLLRSTGFNHEGQRPGVPFRLYDLRVDPREEHDLAAENPEIVARMRRDYRAWFDDVSTTRPDNFAPPRIVIGTPEAPHTVLTRQDWRRTKGRGWGSHGQWLLEAPEDTAVELVAVYRQPTRITEVELTIDGESLTTPYAAHEPSLRIPLGTRRIPAGPLALAVRCRVGDQLRTPYQIELHRR